MLNKAYTAVNIDPTKNCYKTHLLGNVQNQNIYGLNVQLPVQTIFDSSGIIIYVVGEPPDGWLYDDKISSMTWMRRRMMMIHVVYRLCNRPGISSTQKQKISYDLYLQDPWRKKNCRSVSISDEAARILTKPVNRALNLMKRMKAAMVEVTERRQRQMRSDRYINWLPYRGCVRVAYRVRNHRRLGADGNTFVENTGIR